MAYICLVIASSDGDKHKTHSQRHNKIQLVTLKRNIHRLLFEVNTLTVKNLTCARKISSLFHLKIIVKIVENYQNRKYLKEIY